MIELVIGRAKSGKSVYAENLLAQRQGRTLYIGTLPCMDAHTETIRQHRLRRPDHWDLLEMEQNARRGLRAATEEAPRYQNVLLDGFLGYLYRYMLTFHYDARELSADTERLLNYLRGSVEMAFLVDPPVPQSLPVPERQVLNAVRRMTILRAARITYVADGRAQKVSQCRALSEIGSEALITVDR